MILCLCNGVNERSVRDIIRQHNIKTLAKVYKQIGSMQCGNCKEQIEYYIERQKIGIL